MTKDMKVRIVNHGSIIGFEPMNKQAEKWFANNVASESWQWRDGRVSVDARMARDLLQAIIDSDGSIQ